MNTRKRLIFSLMAFMSAAVLISASLLFKNTTQTEVDEPVLGAATVLTTPQGGTGLSTYTRGDTLFSTSTNRLQRLPIGTNGQTMVVSGGLPAWSSNLQWTYATGSSLELTDPGLAYVATGTHIFGGAMSVVNRPWRGGDNVQIGWEQSGARSFAGGADTYKSYSPLNIYASTTGFQDTFTITAGGNGADGACFAAKNLGATLGRQCQTSSPLSYWIMSLQGLAFQSGNITPFSTANVDLSIRDGNVGIGLGSSVTPNTKLEVNGTTSGTQAIIGGGSTSTQAGIEFVVLGTGATSTNQIGSSQRAGCTGMGDIGGTGITYVSGNDGLLFSSVSSCKTSSATVPSQTVQTIEPGPIASRPAAGAAYLNSLYYATDEEATYQCVKTGASTYAWRNVSGSSIVTYLSSSLTGWTAQNGNGTASITGGFKVAIGAAASAADTYPSANNPRYYRDVSSDISGYEDFTIWVRFVSATLGADQNIGICLGDSSDTTGEGVCAFTGTAGQLTCTPFKNAEYVGAPAGVIPFDGTGWIGIARRGGVYSTLAGTGTTSTPPTQYASTGVSTSGSTGQDIPTRLSIYATKYGGGDMDGVFDNVIIKRFQ